MEAKMEPDALKIEEKNEYNVEVLNPEKEVIRNSGGKNEKSSNVQKLGNLAVGTLAVSVLTLGALVAGTVAAGRFAVGQFTTRRNRLGKAEIEE